MYTLYPTMSLELRKFKTGLDAAGLKPHLMSQPLGFRKIEISTFWINIVVNKSIPKT